MGESSVPLGGGKGSHLSPRSRVFSLGLAPTCPLLGILYPHYTAALEVHGYKPQVLGAWSLNTVTLSLQRLDP